MVEDKPLTHYPCIVVLPKQPLEINYSSHVFFELIDPTRWVVVVLHCIADVVLVVERLIQHYEDCLSHIGIISALSEVIPEDVGMDETRRPNL